MNKSNRKILVIGGSGYIGQHIASYAANRHFNVHCTYKKNTKHIKENANVKYIYLDLESEAEIKDFFKKNKYDYIFNAAGYVDHRSFSENGLPIITTHFLSLLYQFQYIDKKILKKYVYLGSADEYPDIGDRPLDETLREKPKNPYAFSKVASTHFLQMLNENEGWPTLICRVFLTFGANQNDHRMVAKILSTAQSGKTVLTTHGRQVRDFCDVDSLAEAILDLAFLQETDGQVVNVASGDPKSVGSIVSLIVNVFGSVAEYGAIPLKRHEALFQYANIDKLREFLPGFESKKIEDFVEISSEKLD